MQLLFSSGTSVECGEEKTATISGCVFLLEGTDREIKIGRAEIDRGELIGVKLIGVKLIGVK